MIGNFHFNTETTLVLLYCLLCVALLFALSLPLPYKAKKPINDLIKKSLYYLGVALIIPAWTLITSSRSLTRFTSEARAPGFNVALQGDKHKGRVIKMQRNLIMGLFAVVCYVLLFRFHKVVARFEDNVNNLQNEVKNSPKQNTHAPDSVAAQLESKKIK